MINDTLEGRKLENPLAAVQMGLIYVIRKDLMEILILF